MNPCHIDHRSRRTLGIFCLTLAAACTAHALPARDNEQVYFADKRMKKEVGHFMMDCAGHSTFSGTRTRFWVRYQEQCPGSRLRSMGPDCVIDGASAKCWPGIERFLCGSGKDKNCGGR